MLYTWSYNAKVVRHTIAAEWRKRRLVRHTGDGESDGEEAEEERRLQANRRSLRKKKRVGSRRLSSEGEYTNATNASGKNITTNTSAINSSNNTKVTRRIAGDF